METTLPSMKLSIETGVNIWHTCSVNEICYNYWTEQICPSWFLSFSLPFLWWLNKDFNILLKSYSYLRFCMSRIISASLVNPISHIKRNWLHSGDFSILFSVDQKTAISNTQTGPNSIRFWLHRTIWSHGKRNGLFLLIGLVFYNELALVIWCLFLLQ